eukprot:jgi/Ulvmu1/5545/UM023_0081.1
MSEDRQPSTRRSCLPQFLYCIIDYNIPGVAQAAGSVEIRWFCAFLTCVGWTTACRLCCACQIETMKIGSAITNVLFASMAIIPSLAKYLLLRVISPGSFKNTRATRVADEGIQHPPVKGVHHEFVLCDDVRIHVARAGMDASKKLILFLHGFPEFWYSWRSQMETLQEDYEVAAIDLPGYNASGKPTRVSHYVTQDICRIVAAVLNGLCRESCILVGHDWGAAIASDFAAMYPKKVERLCLLAVPPGRLFFQNMDLHQLSKSLYMWQMLVPGVLDRLLPANDYSFMDGMFTEPSKGGLLRRSMPDEEIGFYKDAIAVSGALESALRYYRAVLWHTGVMGMNKEVRFAWKSNPRHTMPVLVLVGDSDLAVNLNSLTQVGRVAARATVRILPDCSHWVQQDASDDVNRLLKSFIESETGVL